MVSQLETRLDLAKQGFSSEMLSTKFDDRNAKSVKQKSTFTMKELQNYKMIKMLENREKTAEDAHQCRYCTDFTYLSMVKCNKCDIQFCIWHTFQCGCSVPHIQLVYRYSNEELAAML